MGTIKDDKGVEGVRFGKDSPPFIPRLEKTPMKPKTSSIAIVLGSGTIIVTPTSCVGPLVGV